jgi:hypothetical protein
MEFGDTETVVYGTLAINQGLKWLNKVCAEEFSCEPDFINQLVSVNVKDSKTFYDFREDLEMAIRYGYRDLDANKLKYALRLNLIELSSLINLTETERNRWESILLVSSDLSDYLAEVFRTYLENITFADKYQLAPRGVRRASRAIFTRLTNFFTCTACPCYGRCLLPFAYDYLRIFNELLISIIRLSYIQRKGKNLSMLYKEFIDLLLKEVGGKHKYLIKLIIEFIKDQAIISRDKKCVAWKTTTGNPDEDPRIETMKAIWKEDNKQIRKFIEDNIPPEIYTEKTWVFNLYKKLRDDIYKYGDPQTTIRIIVFLALLKEVFKRHEEFIDIVPLELRSTLNQIINEVTESELINTYINGGLCYLYNTFERYNTTALPIKSDGRQLYDGAWLCTEPVGEFRQRIDHSFISTLEIASGLANLLGYTEIKFEPLMCQSGIDVIKNIISYLINVRLGIKEAKEVNVGIVDNCISFAQWKDIHLVGLDISDVRGLIGIIDFLINTLFCEKLSNYRFSEVEPLNIYRILSNLVMILIRSSTVMNNDLRYWGVASPLLLQPGWAKQIWWTDYLGIQKIYFDELGAIFPSVDNTLEALTVLAKYNILLIQSKA